MEQSEKASNIVVVKFKQQPAIDIAVQAGQQRLDGLGRPFRTTVTKIKSFDDVADRSK